MKTIDVMVTQEGEIIVEAMGFHGQDCEQATAFLEEALGRVDRRTRKPDYYRRVSAKAAQQVGQ